MKELFHNMQTSCCDVFKYTMSNGVRNINIFKIKDSSIYFLVSISLYELAGNLHKIEAQCLHNSDLQNFKHQKHCTKHFINTQQSFCYAHSTRKVAVIVTNSAVNSHIYPPCAFCPASKSTILNTFQVPMCHVLSHSSASTHNISSACQSLTVVFCSSTAIND